MDFSKLNKHFANSFNQQKALLKKLMSGKEVKCDTCQGIIRLEMDATQGIGIARCEKGCTDIELNIQ